MMQPFYVSISAIISNCNHTHVCCYILLFMLSICYHGFCILCGRTIPTTRLVFSPTLCWWPRWHFCGFPRAGPLEPEPIDLCPWIPETHIHKIYFSYQKFIIFGFFGWIDHNNLFDCANRQSLASRKIRSRLHLRATNSSNSSSSSKPF